MQLSGRSSRIGESATLRVSRRASELRAQGIDVIDFGAGEPDFASPACAVAAAQKALADGFTKYTPNNGIPALRKAISARYAERYRAPWSPDRVLVTVGGKAALFELAMALFEEGQEVVLNTPAWVSFPEQIRFAGAQVVEVPTHGTDSFRIHAEPLIAVLSDRTRAVILNSPCNPTGGMISAADLRLLIEACAARGVLVISDETYERFVYTEQGHVSAAPLAAEFPDTVVVVGSFSKTYAMTGWRIGYLLGPAPVVDAAAAVQSHATSNATSFAMVGAVAALAEAEADVERMIAEYRLRRELVVRRLNELPGVRCAPPDGAFYAFPDVSACYRPGIESSMALSEYLLEKVAVAVVAGSAFGDDRHIRISFACSRDTLERGFARLAEALGRAGE